MMAAGTAVSSAWHATRTARRRKRPLLQPKPRSFRVRRPKSATPRPSRHSTLWKTSLRRRQAKGAGGGVKRDVTLREAIESSLPKIAASFGAQPLIEARLRATLGRSIHLLGTESSHASSTGPLHGALHQVRGPATPIRSRA